MISVLVVDDDFMVAKVHSGYVAKTPGFEVAGVAHNGADALRMVGELRPDLVLLDIYLPDTGGLTVLKHIRAAAEDTDVIVISAANDVHTLRGAMRGGDRPVGGRMRGSRPALQGQCPSISRTLHRDRPGRGPAPLWRNRPARAPVPMELIGDGLPGSDSS